MAQLKEDTGKINQLSDLDPGEQAMVAKGIIAIILADGKVTNSEIQYLKSHCRVFLEDDSVITMERVKEYLANRENPEFWELKIFDPAKVHFMLKVFIQAIFSDKAKEQSEIDVYFKIGKLMGISFYLLSEVLKLEKNKQLLREEENRMLEDLDILLKENKRKSGEI